MSVYVFHRYCPQTKFAKVMFSQVSVCPRGVCMAGGHAWQGACMAGSVCGSRHAWQEGHAWQASMHGRGHVWWVRRCPWQEVCMTGGVCMAGWCAWQGVCMAGGVHGRGVHAWKERRQLQRAVRILLECILVINYEQFLEKFLKNLVHCGRLCIV